jgi:hypothetical protein
MNIMLDLETLGTSPGSIILSIGAVAFDNDHLGETFYRVISQRSSIVAGLKADDATRIWWTEQSPAAQQVLRESEAADPDGEAKLDTVLLDFNRFVTRHGLNTFRLSPLAGLWGNGSDFDNVLLISALKAVSRPMAWKYPSNRCYRTLKNLFPDVEPPTRGGVHHNALDDAIFQAKHLQLILREAQITLPSLADVATPSLPEKKACGAAP